MKPYSVCLIGSSHTNGLFQAWKNRTFPVGRDFSLTFFAAAGGRLRSLRHENGILISEDDRARDMLVRTSGGKDRIVASEYDAIVIYAFGLRFADDMLEFCRRYGTAEHQKYGPIETLLSGDCFAASATAILAQSGAIEYLASLRTVYRSPILVCPTPLPPSEVIEEEFSESRFSEPVFLCSVLGRFTHAVSSLCAKHGGEVVWQDESTIESPCFTKDAFGLGSTGFTGKQREGYNKHLNEDFGALALGGLLARLDELSGGRVLQRAGETEVPVGAGAVNGVSLEIQSGMQIRE